ncbi:ABC transporter ATP-binding protein [Methanoculleus sp. FWC-SCC1]|uniref:ABC transporter ATP-binding protein n=1 Tax=Methanoculleus frigidifontis TaxID=2584085 RepID=A0ABT8M924_9EURY|nr:ABC transporter ATP-binding protein [Methanoculleus sp. FWC-SCC1]MDN7024425.1 ABC transporter ATP-binding protein [Methanoculleus sp. FWC-SCC1]
MNRLDVNAVGYAFGSKTVLDGVSMTCAEGELVGVVGPNGCGKTTLMRCMAGYLVPDAGSIAYNGRPLRDLPPRECARIRAVVEQQLVTPFDFSVYEYVMLGRTPYLGRFGSETTEDHRYVEDALGLTGSSPFRDRLIGTLSGGELQRVMIARALAQRPGILLLDEPTSHLDVRYRLEIMHLLRDLGGERAVVAVLHDINDAYAFCDRVLLLRQAKAVAFGPPAEVLTAGALSDVFGVVAHPLEHPGTPAPVLSFTLPTPVRRRRAGRIVVIAGGGSGRHVIASLVHEGYDLRVGVLNEGDRDLELARSLGCPALTEPPFSRIGQGSLDALRDWCMDADAIVLAAMPVGEGNLGNLVVAEELLGTKPLVLFARDQTFGCLDFTGGRGEEAYRSVAQGAPVASSVGELLGLLEREIPKAPSLSGAEE